MFEKEMIIASLRKQRDVLKDLVDEFEERPRLREQDLQYCENSLKAIEQSLRRIRKSELLIKAPFASRW